MRRTTAPRTPTTRDASFADAQEGRIRVLEAAYAFEQQRRDELEKKYARLKRRYVRLERAHAVLKQSNEGSTTNTTVRSPEASPASSSTTSSSSSSVTRRALAIERTESHGSVIDLTSPVASRRTSLASPARSNGLAGMRSHSSQEVFQSDDFCAQSPTSPATDANPTPSRRVTRSSRPAEQQAPRESPATSTGVGSTRRRQLEFYTPDPSSRPRPRLGSNSSSEVSSSIRLSTTRYSRSPPSPARQSPASHHSPIGGEASPAISHTSDITNRSAVGSSPAAGHNAAAAADDSDEAASIALAQYLQQQENHAAYEEYRERYLAAASENEHHNHQYGSAAAAAATATTVTRHHGTVDPDNMTYEELLQLGEDVGDVKKDRWRQVAVQVLSSLPTHRWTSRSSDDISCIICQDNFSVGDVALSLPCAHVFHEDCVTGWVRENNSCPLCKLEIADV